MEVELQLGGRQDVSSTWQLASSSSCLPASSSSYTFIQRRRLANVHTHGQTKQSLRAKFVPSSTMGLLPQVTTNVTETATAIPMNNVRVHTASANCNSCTTNEANNCVREQELAKERQAAEDASVGIHVSSTKMVHKEDAMDKRELSEMEEGDDEFCILTDIIPFAKMEDADSSKGKLVQPSIKAILPPSSFPKTRCYRQSEDSAHNNSVDDTGVLNSISYMSLPLLIRTVDGAVMKGVTKIQTISLPSLIRAVDGMAMMGVAKMRLPDMHPQQQQHSLPASIQQLKYHAGKKQTSVHTAVVNVMDVVDRALDTIRRRVSEARSAEVVGNRRSSTTDRNDSVQFKAVSSLEKYHCQGNEETVCSTANNLNCITVTVEEYDNDDYLKNLVGKMSSDDGCSTHSPTGVNALLSSAGPMEVSRLKTDLFEGKKQTFTSEEDQSVAERFVCERLVAEAQTDRDEAKARIIVVKTERLEQCRSATDVVAAKVECNFVLSKQRSLLENDYCQVNGNIVSLEDNVAIHSSSASSILQHMVHDRNDEDRLDGVYEGESSDADNASISSSAESSVIESVESNDDESISGCITLPSLFHGNYCNILDIAEDRIDDAINGCVGNTFDDYMDDNDAREVIIDRSVPKNQLRRTKYPQNDSSNSHRNGRASQKVRFSPSTKRMSKEGSFDSVHRLPSIDDFDFSS